jgi:N-methylhydantoinase B
MTNKKTSADGVRLALLSNRFEGIARKMANTLMRTGRSGVLNIARDFSCCIVTRDHHLLTSADSLPIHVLSGPDLMAKSMLEFHPTLRRGDAFLHNSPYHGCSHPADHTILVPVVDDEGIHRYTVLAKAHQADCGNSVPTTYMAQARDVYEEGALIFPAIRVQEDYQTLDDIVRMCPHENPRASAMAWRFPRDARRRAYRRTRAARTWARGWLGRAARVRTRLFRLQRSPDEDGNQQARSRQGELDLHP